MCLSWFIELCVINGIQGGTLKPWREFVEGLFGGVLGDPLTVKPAFSVNLVVSFALQRSIVRGSFFAAYCGDPFQSVFGSWQ